MQSEKQMNIRGQRLSTMVQGTALGFTFGLMMYSIALLVVVKGTGMR